MRTALQNNVIKEKTLLCRAVLIFGDTGNPLCFLHHCMRECLKSVKQASSKPTTILRL